MPVKVDIRDSNASIFIGFAQKKLLEMKKLLEQKHFKDLPFLKKRIQFDNGTVIYIKAVRTGIDEIRIESGIPVLFLYNTIDKKRLCFSVIQNSEGMKLIKTVTYVPVTYEDKMLESLTISGQRTAFICDSMNTDEIKYLKIDAYLGYVQAPTPYHDSTIDDGIWCYGYVFLAKKWFPVNFEWFFYSAKYGTGHSKEPTELGKRQMTMVYREPKTSEPYGRLLKCGGRHPYELVDDPDDPENHNTLLYKDIYIEGENIYKPFQWVQNERNIDLSFFSTMYGTRKRIYRTKYIGADPNDNEEELETELFRDESDNEAKTCKQYTPLAVLSHDKILYHVDEYTQDTPIKSKVYFGSIGRYGEHDQYHTYCCAYVYLAMRILYRDPDSGEAICEEVHWVVKLTCSLPLAIHKETENSTNKKTLMVGDKAAITEYLYRNYVTHDQNPQDGFHTVGKGDRPLPQIECPWPTVASGANDWNLLPGQDEREVRTWGAKFHSGPIKFSDHVSDPLNTMAPVDLEEDKKESGCFELSWMNYDNAQKDKYFIGIARKVFVDNHIVHTTLFYFNEDGDLNTYQQIMENDRYRVNEGPTTYTFKGISSYPVIQSFTGKRYYLVDGKPRIQERKEEDKRTYRYEMVVYVDSAYFTFPIQWTGYEYFTYRFESTQETDADLLQVSELTGPVYPVQTFHFESESTFNASGNRVVQASVFIDLEAQLMGYTYVVQKAHPTSHQWEFYKRIVGAVSTQYLDEDEKPVQGEIVINDGDEDYKNFNYDQLCALGIKL